MQNFKQLQLKHVSNRNRQKFQQGGSIVDYLKSQGLASDWNTRKAMARRYGVSDYKGTADQNLRLMELIKMNQELSPTTTMQGVPVTREVGNGRVETYTPDITVKNPGYIDMSKYKKPVVQSSTFNQAFRDARKAGLTEFEWNGGRYNTMTAEEAAAKKGANTNFLYYINKGIDDAKTLWNSDHPLINYVKKTPLSLQLNAGWNTLKKGSEWLYEDLSKLGPYIVEKSNTDIQNKNVNTL